ncbi:MAG: DUF1349 domain-containing protein [Rikenellaceae bacterium]|nr:DUF1349 domain-containing protein [Rikenellaceae bacterium]
MKKLLIATSVVLVCVFVACAQNKEEKVTMQGIPYPLEWVNTPLSWDVDGSDFTLVGGKGSRLFVDPRKESRDDTGPMLLFQPDETFLFSCKMKVEFGAVFDAGVLMIYDNTDLWAKLCFEYAPDPEQRPTMVSVINKKYSDDSNHHYVDGDEVYARIAGLGGGAYAFHYSMDGETWYLLRYFEMGTDKKLRIGFLSQSPRGEQCKTVFSEIKYSSDKLGNIRSGE